MPPTPAATFCATLVDEWIRGGVRHVVVAPGSRSTPLALALAARSDVELSLFHDERAAAFAALGIGLATGHPAVLLCTSGTAAAEFHAAVIEAHQAEVPLIVCTADRPPELRDVGAAQTVDQIRLFGPAVRWFHDPGVPEAAQAPTWRAVAARSIAAATGSRPGPVHLNLPFREPLVGDAGALPEPRPSGSPWVRTIAGPARLDPAQLAAVVTILDRQRGVIVAGGGTAVRDAADAIHGLAAQLGWPVLADPRSGARVPKATTIAAFDSMLRHAGFAADHAPEVVLRFGTPPASKELAQWILRSEAVDVQVQAGESWLDPAHRSAVRIVADPARLCQDLQGQLVGASRTPWLARWRRAEQRAQAAIAGQLPSDGAISEPAVARALVEALPDAGQLVVSSSMPVRDVEWFAAPRDGVQVHANRGANGIDGVVATAVGVATGSGAPTALLIGDVAFVHDSAALIGLGRRSIDLTIVVVDNDGGGIFSFLPQATQLPPDRFELLFGTPHGTDLGALAAAHGLDFHELGTLGELSRLVRAPGVRIVRASTDRAVNVAIHERITTAVRAELG